MSDGQIHVTCSLGHTSRLLHSIDAFGNLIAPPNTSPSLHCGTCNELFPIPHQLGDWKPTSELYTPPKLQR